MELESRIEKVIFSHDMYNWINDDSVHDQLEDISQAIQDNTIVNLKINEDTHKNWISSDMSEADICGEIAGYIKSEGGYIIQLNTPIPKNIQKKNETFNSWSSYGFGYCRIVVIYVKNFENIKLEINKYEEEMLEEIYKQEQLKKENK